MLNQEALDKIETFLSSKRVNCYKEKFAKNWFEFYKLELAQAKEIFIYLHFLEIFLRNKIATEFNEEFGNWFSIDTSQLIFNFEEKDKIDKAISILIKTGKPINLDNIVSNLNLGFWTNLFQKPYHDHIWQRNKMIDRVFPFLKPQQRNLVNIQKEMGAIRKFRNRVFHFENLQGWNFTEMRNLIDKFIYGICGVRISEILG